MPTEPPTARPLTEQDAARLIGVLATLEGHLTSHQADLGDHRSEPSRFHDDLLESLARRLRRDGALADDVPIGPGVREALGALTARLRDALGEDPGPDRG